MPSDAQGASPQSPRKRPEDPLVSVVIPVLNEQDCVEPLVQRVRQALAQAGVRGEILFVDDGSADETPARIAKLQRGAAGIKNIRFTRSFGHQAALAAGLRYARGDAVVSMDGDLQHPPERLPAMIGAWQEGVDVVYTVRRPRRDWKDRLGQLFYRSMRMLTSVPIVPGGADFRLLDRRVVDAFNQLPEHFVLVRALVPWLGFQETRIEYDAGERVAGRSKYGTRRMVRLALDGIFSFSVLPLRVIAVLGVLTSLFGVGFAIFSFASYFSGRVVLSGWTSLVTLILIFGGVQLLCIAILSEYVGRNYEEAKRRPLYVIDYVTGLDGP